MSMSKKPATTIPKVLLGDLLQPGATIKSFLVFVCRKTKLKTEGSINYS